MRILLTQDVPNLGKAGETHEVKDGYARNYLIPQGMARMATAGLVKQATAQKDAQRRKDERKTAARSTLADRIKGAELVFKAKVGEQHRLYGSITSGDIAEELSRKVGETIDKRDVELEEPLRHLGSFKVPVRVGPNLTPSVNVVVEPE